MDSFYYKLGKPWPNGNFKQSINILSIPGIEMKCIKELSETVESKRMKVPERRKDMRIQLLVLFEQCRDGGCNKEEDVQNMLHIPFKKISHFGNDEAKEIEGAAKT